MKEILPNTENLCSVVWHGTGRYQYDDEGNVMDVLESILSNGGFAPRHDEYDLRATMQTTSFARAEEYARLYAEMHRNNPNNMQRAEQKERFETYTKGIARAAITDYLREFGITQTIKKTKQMRDTHVRGQRWSRKIHSESPKMKTAFVEGSDIPGNYPVLLEMESIENTEPISDYLAKHEVRTRDAIPLEAIRRIEVPVENLAETRQHLEQHGVSIPLTVY